MMGDKLTLAMLVQLRDPLRNYEPVGQPMLAMVQAERVLQQAPPQRRTKRQARLEAKQHMLQLEGGQKKQVAEGGQKRIMGPEEERGEEEGESAPQGTVSSRCGFGCLSVVVYCLMVRCQRCVSLGFEACLGKGKRLSLSERTR
jgi:hypothetical protein